MGGLSTAFSSTSPLEKSMAAEAASSAVHIMKGPEKTEGLKLPPADPNADLDLEEKKFSDLERRLFVNLCLLGNKIGLAHSTCTKYTL